MNTKLILSLLGTLLIGAVLGALVFRYAYPELFVTKSECPSAESILADFEEKIQNKIANRLFPLLSMESCQNCLSSVNVFSGEVVKIDSPDSFIVKTKNVFQGGSIVDFVSKQPDFYEIKILTDEKTVISEFVLPSSPEAQATTPTEKPIKISDLKEGQSVYVVLSETVDLTKAQSAKASSVQVLGSNLLDSLK